MKSRVAFIAALYVSLTVTVFLMGQSAAHSSQDSGGPQAAPPGAPAGAPGGEKHHVNSIYAEGSVQHLTQELGLSEEQQRQASNILRDQQNEMLQLRQDASLQPPERMQKMLALREATTGRIRAILDGSQQKRYDQMQRTQNGLRSPAPATKAQ